MTNLKKYTKNFSPFTSHLSLPPRGYTLIEMLVVIGVLGSIGTIITGIIFVSLRGAQKSDTLEVIRQNGDAALSQMVKNIRYAKSLDIPSSCIPSTTVSSVTFTALDSGQTTLSCSANTISSNSASLLDTNAVATSTCSFTCFQPTLNDPPTITIQFTLTNKVPSNFIERSGSTSFQSSVSMRNFIRR